MREEYKMANALEGFEPTPYDPELPARRFLRAYNKPNDARQDAAFDQSRAEGGKDLVCWISGVGVMEFVAAYDDVLCVFPEAHAAILAAKHGAEPFVKYTKTLGYSDDICSFCRINIAYSHVLKDDAPDAPAELMEAFEAAPKLPRPDFIVVSNNTCSLVPKWYGEMARYFNVPFFCIDTPYWQGTDTPQDQIDYMNRQFKDLIAFLEDVTGRPFDQERFDEVQQVAAATGEQWTAALDAGFQKPCPADGFTWFNFLTPVMASRFAPGCLDAIKYLTQEENELAAKGETLYPAEEKYRILFDGIAVWPWLRFTSETLQQHGVNVVASMHTRCWSLHYEPGNLESLALAYLGRAVNRDFEYNVQERVRICKEGQIDGILVHVNRSCQVVNAMQHAVLTEVGRRCDIPVAFFDGDHCDPLLFSKAQYETRVQALVEAMEAQKEAKA